MVLLFSACDEQRAAVADNVPDHTATFYLQHPLEAEMVARLCTQLDARNKKTLDAAAYQEWLTSEDWKRCENAIFVIDSRAIGTLF